MMTSSMSKRWPDKFAALVNCKSHNECQYDIEAPKVVYVEMPNPLADPLAPNRDWLIGRQLRADPQSVFIAWIDCDAKVGGVDDLGCCLGNYYRSVGFGKRVDLDNDRRSGLPIIAWRRDDNHIATSHRSQS